MEKNFNLPIKLATDTCSGCPCYKYESMFYSGYQMDRHFCLSAFRQIFAEEQCPERPDWCPLQELPIVFSHYI